jgi:uncharacterized membrane protein
VASALFTTLGSTAVGVGFGAATGGLLGALIDLGFSEEDAVFYAEGVKRGGILVYVETDPGEENKIKAILRGAGAIDRNSRPQAWQNQRWTTMFDETQRDNVDHERSYKS